MNYHKFTNNMSWGKTDYQKVLYLAEVFSKPDGPCPKGVECPKNNFETDTVQDNCFKCWKAYLITMEYSKRGSAASYKDGNFVPDDDKPTKGCCYVL